MQTFLFVYVPSVQNYYNYLDCFNAIKNGVPIRNLAQSVIMFTIVFILTINDDESEIGIWTKNLAFS